MTKKQVKTLNICLNRAEFDLIRDLLVLERYQLNEDLHRRFGKCDAASEKVIEDKRVISNLLRCQFSTT